MAKGKKKANTKASKMTKQDTAVVAEEGKEIGAVKAESAETVANATDAKPVAPKAIEAKKPGRKPMTEAEKAEAKKVRDAMKVAAANMKPEFILQFQGQDMSLNALSEAVKADFKANHKRSLLTELKIYFVPEHKMAYYVANGSIEGSIPM